MSERIRHQANPAPRPASQAGAWPLAAAAAICAAVRADRDYRPTPLLPRPALARALGLGAVLIKNEGARLAAEGLASFKPVGALGAFAHLRLTGATRPDRVVCASDGNFGRAVAWAARRAGIAATVYLPQAVSPGRIAAIRAFGARAVVVAGGYDRAMAAAARAARHPGVLEMTDTGHPGARDIPAAIQDAYGVIADEILAALPDPARPPTHLFVPVGVGGLAAGLAAALDGRLGPAAPALVSVQPAQTPSLLLSLQARALRSAPEATGPGPGTLMQCLACETPSTTAWPVLSARLAHALAIDDTAAVAAMRALARPADDPPVAAGESGAAAFGALLAVCADPDMRARVGLDATSRVVVLVTEGVTDPETYRCLVP